MSSVADESAADDAGGRPWATGQSHTMWLADPGFIKQMGVQFR
jgi:hypothetical protein